LYKESVSISSVVSMITIYRCRWQGRSRKRWINGWNRGYRASWTPRAPGPCSISDALQHRHWSGPC